MLISKYDSNHKEIINYKYDNANNVVSVLILHLHEN